MVNADCGIMYSPASVARLLPHWHVDLSQSCGFDPWQRTLVVLGWFKHSLYMASSVRDGRLSMGEISVDLKEPLGGQNYPHSYPTSSLSRSCFVTLILI